MLGCLAVFLDALEAVTAAQRSLQAGGGAAGAGAEAAGSVKAEKQVGGAAGRHMGWRDNPAAGRCCSRRLPACTAEHASILPVTCRPVASMRRMSHRPSGPAQAQMARQRCQVLQVGRRRTSFTHVVPHSALC